MEFISCRAIIIKDNKLVVMQRKKKGRQYCTFPGGHIEINENPVQCVKREVLEEFGIEVEPTKLVYVYEYKGGLQGFYVANWISGNIHITDSEEYTNDDTNKGTYNPTMINISDMKRENLMPPEVVIQLDNDYKLHGSNLNDRVLYIKGE